MSGIESIQLWFHRWWRAHRIRHPHADLPELGCESGAIFYEPWIEEFAAARVTEPDADAASKRLVAMAPHPGQHFRALLGLARSAVDSRAVPAAEDPAKAAARAQEAADTVRLESDRARWARLPEERRDAYRADVKNRFPELAESGAFVEAMARAWYCDPSSRPGPRPSVPGPAAPGPFRRREDWWDTRRPEPNVPASNPPA